MEKKSHRRAATAARSNADNSAAAAFARAMARSVFGRNYVNDRDLAEVWRSVSHAARKGARSVRDLKK